MTSNDIYSRDFFLSQFEQYEIRDREHLNLYLDLIEQIQLSPPSGYSEKHHVLPKSLFPKYKRDQRNLIHCSAYDHFVLHYHIAKSIKSRSLTFALNQMNRVKTKLEPHQIYDLANMYEEFRLEHSQYISEMNSGRVASDEQRKKLSEISKNTVVVYDITKPELGNFRVSTTDPKYISGEYVHCRTGYKHTSETLSKLKICNSAESKGKIYTNKTTGEMKYFVEIPNDDWYSGRSESFSNTCSNSFTGFLFWYNPQTGEQIRSKTSPGEGWENTRVFDNPFSNKRFFYNCKTGETVFQNNIPDGDWWVPRDKRLYVYENDQAVFCHYDETVIAVFCNIPVPMVGIWAHNCIRRPNSKIRKTPSFYKCSKEEQAYIDGKEWGSINLRRLKKHETDTNTMIWIDAQSLV